MARPLKYKNMVIHITEWLKDELKHDAEVVNGLPYDIRWGTRHRAW